MGKTRRADERTAKNNHETPHETRRREEGRDERTSIASKGKRHAPAANGRRTETSEDERRRAKTNAVSEGNELTKTAHIVRLQSDTGKSNGPAGTELIDRTGRRNEKPNNADALRRYARHNARHHDATEDGDDTSHADTGKGEPTRGEPSER